MAYVVVSTLARSISALLDHYSSIRATRTIPFTDRENAHHAAHVAALPPYLDNAPNKRIAWEVEDVATSQVRRAGQDTAKFSYLARVHRKLA